MKYISLYPHIKSTTGIRGTLLFDYVTNKLIRLNKPQSEILLQIDRDIDELVQLFNPDEVRSLLNLIEENSLGKVSNIKYPKNYPVSDRPSKIDICEMEYEKNSVSKFNFYINKLLKHGCSTFVFLFDSVNDFQSFLDIAEHIPLSINIKFNNVIPLTELSILSELIQLDNIYFVHLANSSPSNVSAFSNKIIWMTESKKIAPYEEVYTRSLYGHPYFLGRIFIDRNGLYSNGYRNKDFYGDLNVDTISRAIENLISRGNWLVKRQNIIQCSKCEFRDICLDDSKLIRMEGELLYSLAEKCKYEPVY